MKKITNEMMASLGFPVIWLMTLNRIGPITVLNFSDTLKNPKNSADLLFGISEPINDRLNA